MSTAETPQSVDTTITAPMADPERQTAIGKVLWHFTMSLDGFVAGPNHAMDWMTGFSLRPGLVQEYVETTGAVLGGRDGLCLPRCQQHLRRRMAGPGVRPHAPSGRRAARQRRHFPELRCGRGAPNRAGGRRRQES